MGDAMVHAHDRHLEGKGQRSGPGGHGAQAWPQPRTLGECDQVDVLEGYPGLLHRRLDRWDELFGVMVSRLPGMDASFLRPVHVDLVGKDVAFGVDDAYAACMGRSLYAERYHMTLGTNR